MNPLKLTIPINYDDFSQLARVFFKELWPLFDFEIWSKSYDPYLTLTFPQSFVER